MRTLITCEPQSNQEAPLPSQSQATPNTKENTKFHLQRISDGWLCPFKDRNCSNKDIRFKNFMLLASDGHTLHLTSSPFPSVERCKKYFESSIKEAKKILRRTPESNTKGEPIGERALGLFSPETEAMKARIAVPYYKVFWVWEASYWQITGEHLEDVQALEERLKEEGMNAVWGWD